MNKKKFAISALIGLIFFALLLIISPNLLGGSGSIMAFILYGTICIWLIYSLYIYYKAQPEMFSLANINKGLTTMGLLAIALIALISVTIILL